MKHILIKLPVLLLFFLTAPLLIFAQQIDINAGYGGYEPANFPGYGNNIAAQGLFYSSAGKTSGVIPAYTAQLTIVLAPEVPWTGASFVIPVGWEMDPASTTTNLTFYNSSDWTTEEPYFEIPVMAIAPRSSIAQSVGTQVFNIGGDWVDDGEFNNTTSAVTVVDNPLPVTLTAFTARREGQIVNLEWATTTETNSDHFEIQHSLNGKNWKKAGVVESSGESKTLKNYTFIHNNPSDGENLYRLKMVDKDQTFAYSRIRSVKFQKEGLKLVAYPNPASDILFLKNYEGQSLKEVSITNTSGFKVYQSNSVSSDGINVKTLSSGIYAVRIIETNGALHTLKVVINR